MAETAAPLQPPVAKKIPVSTTLHGDTRVDNYAWMREKTNPDVTAYLEAENAYTDSVMKHTETFQESLYKEILGRIKETDLTVPFREGNHFYYSRTEEGKQYPIHCRKAGSLDAPEQVTLDLNAMAVGHTFMAIDSYDVSDDGNLLAYSTDSTGFREYELHVKDLRTGEILPLVRQKVSSVAWASDNKTIFYVVDDSAKRAYRLYRHTLGDAAPDALLYEEKDELFRLSVGGSRSREFIFLTSDSHTASEVRFLRANTPAGEFQVVQPRAKDLEYAVAHHGDSFYIRVNDTGRNFRLVKTPIAKTTKENWVEVVPHRDAVMLEDTDFFAEHYVLYERENAIPRLRITEICSGATHTVEFPEPVYAVFPSSNHEFHTKTLRFSYQSLVTPSSVFDYDMSTRSRELMKQTEVLGGYDASKYQSERVYATAKDGTRIPISMVYRKDLVKDGQRPLYLVGYGSYGYPYPVHFSSARLSLLDRGVICAIAQIRGGGDMGKPWHDAGRMANKMNTFTDFIASAEHLIGEKYTSADRLVVEGGSAGGLLMGAVTNLRPDLFKAVIAKVPFVDVLNTMLDASLPLTVGEYEEWGNPNEKDAYLCMKGYCPYTNLTAKAYPNMLLKTGFNDSQVMYWEPAKYIAKLRTLKTDSNVQIFKTDMGSGHGGASGRYDFLKQVAFDYAYLLWQVGKM